MSDPNPKRTRAKASATSPAASGIAIDSQAAPAAETSPQAQQARQQGAGNSSAAIAGNTASDAATTANKQQQSQQAIQAAQVAKPAGTQDAGNVPKPTVSSDTRQPLAGVRYQDIREILQKHAEWPRILATVREMRADSKLAAMKTEARERFIWGEMDRLYPRILIDPKAQPVALLKSDSPQVDTGNDLRRNSEAPPLRDGGVKGLGDVPIGWPPLPANASLAAELAWVQANRLYVVEEQAGGGARVHLDRAHEPAPSRSAIGWLETSIRSYSKFVEVAAKATGSGDEDGEQVKRERLAIEEIRGLLEEMAGNPTGSGR